MSTTSKSDMNALHGIIAKELTRRIEGGEATAADLSAAIKFLKDNGIDCVSNANEDVSSLADTMKFPFDADDGDEENIVPFSRS